jgi:hypothetical protein
MMFSLNDISFYIFCWKKVVANSCKLYEEIKQVCPNVTIINSDETQPLDSAKYDSIQLDDSDYYGSQLQTAIKATPSGKILACLTGDIELGGNWAAILGNVVKYINMGNIGIVAPKINGSEWQEKKALVVDDLWAVDHCDRICWFIHPQIWGNLGALEFKQLSNFGFAIHKVFTLECYAHNMISVCDYSQGLTHPDGSGYNRDEANQQMNALLNSYNSRPTA